MTINLLTKKQAAEALGMSIVSIDRLRRCGRLNSRRVGAGNARGNVRFTEQDILDFLERSSTRPEKPTA
jgi:hypothetical protein